MRKNKALTPVLLTLLLPALLAALAPHAPAEPLNIVKTATYPVHYDTTIINTTTTNFGKTAYLSVGARNVYTPGTGLVPTNYRSLIHFTVLPKSHKVVSAKLRLCIAQKLISTELSILIVRATKPWKEYEATWTMRTASLPWSKPGGDYSVQPSYLLMVVQPTAPLNTPLTLDITSLYQSLQEYGNYGLELLVPDIYLTGGWLSFHSSESPNTKCRPAVIVTYKPPAVTIDAPSTITIGQGDTRVVQVAVNSQQIDAAKGVQLQVSAQPPSATGIQLALTAPTTASYTATLTVHTSPGTPPGHYTAELTATAYTEEGLKVTAKKTITIAVTQTAWFNLTADKQSLHLHPGATATLTVTAAPHGPYTSPVTLTATTPQCIDVQPAHLQLSPGQPATLTVHAQTGCQPGDYTIKLTAHGPGCSDTLEIQLTVAQQPSYQLHANTTHISTTAGKTAAVEITLTGPPSQDTTATLTVSGDTPHTLTPTTLHPGDKAILKVTPTQPGDYAVKIAATWQTGTATLTLHVHAEPPAQPPKPSFTLTARPTTIEVNQGEAATFTIHLTPRSGEQQPALITLHGLPSDATYTVHPNPATPPATVTVTINAGAHKGTYHVVVEAATPTHTETTHITLVVKEQRCIIATATYGGPQAPQVAFLRAYRDTVVLKTYSGRMFLRVFNAFYYSWSPHVAQYMHQNPWTKPIAAALLAPLITSLHASALAAHPLQQAAPEASVYTAGTVAAALIGITYLTPLILAALHAAHRNPKPAIHLPIATALLLTATLAAATLHLDTATGIAATAYLAATATTAATYTAAAAHKALKHLHG